MTSPRLLPILLFALASLFVLKSIDLLGRGGLEVGGPAPAYAGSDAPQVTDVRSVPDDLTGSFDEEKEPPASEKPAEVAPDATADAAPSAPPATEPAKAVE